MASKDTTEQQAIYVAIWTKAVETQMHFNEMSVKSRQFGLAFVAAALGLGIALISRDEDYSLLIPFFGGFDLNMTVLIAFAGAGALYGVKLLDLNVYHKMLRGAVAFNEDFERHYMKKIFSLEKGMTEAISHFSRYEDAFVEDKPGEKYTYKGEKKKSALIKIRWFYRVSIGMLCVLGMALFFATAHFGEPQSGIRKHTTKERSQKKEEDRPQIATPASQSPLGVKAPGSLPPPAPGSDRKE